MNVAYGNLWDMEADVYCVTTNGTVLDVGANIMGGGAAREAAARSQAGGLPFVYGDLIKRHGHHCYLIEDMVMFPTKETIEEDASLPTISRSLWELNLLWTIYKWDRILLPSPGTGLGGLPITEVDMMLGLWEGLIPDFMSHITIVRYEKEEAL